MNKTKVKKEIKRFLGQIDHAVSLTSLQQQAGYTIYFYNKQSLDNDKLLTAIGAAEYAKTVNSFCIEQDWQRIVFVSDSVDYEEKVFLVLHEIGHLVLDHHKNQDTYFAITLEQEQEANFFAEGIYKYDKNKLVKRNILLTSILAGFVLIGSAYFLANHINHSTATKIDNTQCFITATGHRYHIGCDHLKNNEGIVWLTIKEAKDKGYTPCKDCVPEKYKNSDV